MFDLGLHCLVLFLAHVAWHKLLIYLVLSGIQRKRKRGTYRALGPKELYRACCQLVKDQGELDI